MILLLTLLLLHDNTAVQLSPTQTKQKATVRSGPCILNEDGMKCTKKGYYETVQCDSRGCFCVAANTGFIAYDTRTLNNKTLPNCSNCHITLKNLFADGDVPSGTFVPKCDVTLGNYEPLQCDSRREWCYCVDVISGRELPNTRKRTGTNKYIRCGKTEHSLDPAKFPTTEESNFTTQERYPVGREWCKLSRNKGRKCKDNKPSVRYYFDFETFSCLAFEYLGCDGNANNYRSTSDCSSECKLQDLSGCSGMYPAARKADGQSFLCGGGPQQILAAGLSSSSTFSTPGPKLNEDGCPSGTRCIMGAFFGFCCNEANEDRFNAAYHRKCPDGRDPYSVMQDSWRETHFGKTCEDNFCPAGYKCHDGDIFAYCC